MKLDISFDSSRVLLDFSLFSLRLSSPTALCEGQGKGKKIGHLELSGLGNL